jgi:NADH-quinone oxidoreductase subunit L
MGAAASLLTATYMGRLVFLTFFGERRHDAPAAPGHAKHAQDQHSTGGHDASHAHDHAHGLHDAPPAMAFALIVLAIGSVLAGYVGVPHGLGGHNQLGAWLAPSFAAPVGAQAVAGAEALPESRAQSPESEHGEEALELTLMAVSSGIAIAGIALACFIWVMRREIADRMARDFAPIYRLLLNKYYVDELYDASVVQPTVVVSREGLWRAVDVGVIDGAVNGVAALVDAGAATLRRLQTGSVRTYASSLFLGVVLVLGYYLWR